MEAVVERQSATEPTQHHAERVQVKLFAVDPGAIDAKQLVPIFHAWIRDDALGEMVIDVADYTHVHHGPGIVLVGHGSDYYYDLGEGRPGVLYSRKRALDGDLAARLEDALKRALRAASLLERDGALGGKLAFRGDELLVRVPDRLHAPNDDDTWRIVRDILTPLLERVYAGAAFTLDRIDDPKGPLAVRVKSEAKPSVSELLARLE